MKRLISTTTALAMVLASGPVFPVLAQDFPQAVIDGQTVLCLPNKQTECPEGALCTVSKKPENCEKNAIEFLAELAAGTATEAPATTEATATDTTAVTTTETTVTTEEPAAGSDATVVTEPVVTAETTTDPETATPDAPAALAFEPFEVMVGTQAVLCLPDKSVECPEGQICTFAKTQDKCEANATKKVAKMAPVDVIVPDQAQVDALDEAIADPATTDPTKIDAVVATDPAEGSGGTTLPADTATSSEATVTDEVLTEDDTRASTQEFDAAPKATSGGKKSGLTDLETAGLIVLGTLAVGALLSNGNQVVENSGDRVVVLDQNGNYNIYKDDNALLREPGTRVRTETFADGSTRTVMVRKDGTQVVTIRDATGRVLRRSAYDANGVEVVLIDDLQPERPVNVGTLPKPDHNQTISDTSTMPELLAQLEAIGRADYAHSFSLRQIREIREVRDLAPTIDVNSITFDTGSSAIKESEAKKLQRLGKLMKGLIERHPGEMFLVEGHTDAVGKASYNLALSDRRAESVAKALTEYYGVPAQNLVVQGYGEKELKVESQGDERKNRRAVVRIITPLLKVGAN